MNTKIEKFESGWVGLSIALGVDEIDLLLQRLTQLKAGELCHFHLRSADFQCDFGVADIEITTIGDRELNKMMID